MAEKVIDKVMEMVRPENDGGVYSLIADLYVLGGKLSEAERLRELMVKQNVRKGLKDSKIINLGPVRFFLTIQGLKDRNYQSEI
ncbi:hypothetical protein ACS0TY_035352 [Phlomoides rotata]